MRISKRAEYALRALIDLGIARELGQTILQVQQLAASEKIPAKFLEQILSQLRRAGYLNSLRGKKGGYSLRKPASRVILGDVIRLMDGPLAPISCVSETAYAPCSCPDESHCGLRIVMMDVRTAISGILDRYSLADVVSVTLRKIRRDGVQVPFLQMPLKDCGAWPVQGVSRRCRPPRQEAKAPASRDGRPSSRPSSYRSAASPDGSSRRHAGAPKIKEGR